MSEFTGIFAIIQNGKVLAKCDDVTVTNITNIGSVSMPDDVLPKNFDPHNSFTVKLKLSKRKGRKLLYSLERLFGKRVPKYRSKRELMSIYQQAFCPQGLPMPIDDYLKHTHRQLENLLINTAYIVKKERESRHVFLPLSQVETPVEQTH